jgi:3-methylcrotonyl-CoA carboxylase beta subunit
LVTVKREQLEAKGERLSREEEEAIAAPIRRKYEEEGNPFYSTARLWDDGILDPRQTRHVLGLALGAALNGDFPPYRAPVFRM